MRIRTLIRACALAFTVPCGVAQAAIELPGGDFFLNGTFDFTWGTSGAARIDTALHVGGNDAFPSGLDQTYQPADQVVATGLEFDYGISGLGTGTARIAYRITNNTGTGWHDLRFFSDVFGDIGDAQREIVSVIGSGGTAGEPSHHGADDFFTGDLFLNDILNAGQLDDGNHCAGACEAEGALQWQLDELGAGQAWLIEVSLSDEGLATSQHRLEFLLADGAGLPLEPSQILTISGVASVVTVPLPAGLLPFAVALATLGARRRMASRTAG